MAAGRQALSADEAEDARRQALEEIERRDQRSKIGGCLTALWGAKGLVVTPEAKSYQAQLGAEYMRLTGAGCASEDETELQATRRIIMERGRSAYVAAQDPNDPDDRRGRHDAAKKAASRLRGERIAELQRAIVLREIALEKLAETEAILVKLEPRVASSVNLEPAQLHRVAAFATAKLRSEIEAEIARLRALLDTLSRTK